MLLKLAILSLEQTSDFNCVQLIVDILTILVQRGMLHEAKYSAFRICMQLNHQDLPGALIFCNIFIFNG